MTHFQNVILMLNVRFPDATAADLQRFDSTCIVCRDEIQEGGKKLPCGHILHKKCLKRYDMHGQLMKSLCVMTRGLQVAGAVAHVPDLQRFGL